MSVSEIRLYKILREKMGEEQAQLLVEYVESKIEAEFQEKQYVLATKQDLLVLKEELFLRMDSQRDQLIERMDSQRDQLNEKIDGQVIQLIGKLDTQKDQLIERMDSQKDQLIGIMDSLRDEMNSLKVQVKSDKADVIKWMFIFWAGQLAAMFALFKIFFD